jgi:serine protease
MRVRAVIAGCVAFLSVSPAAAASTTTTGNLLVLLDRDQATATATAAAARAAVRATIAAAGGRPAGFEVPQIGLITVRPERAKSLSTLARRLRRVRGVASVRPEHRLIARVVPNDPALTAPARDSGVLEWVLARENFYGAWDIARGNGALVGVIDTGIDGTHPDLTSKIAAALDQQDPSDARGSATTDEVGHGTHVASLACAGTGNGIGMAGAGYDCRLVVEKSDLSDSSIAASIVDATDRHVQALNMSFGPGDGPPSPAPDSEVRALDYAAAHKVVLVAAAGDNPGAEQGDPANVLQPAGTAANLSAGIGLDVTAAAYNGARASFAGYGSEISLAAFGALDPDSNGLLGIGAPPPGIFGAFPASSADLEGLPQPCGCRTAFQGSSSYAYLQGTSMAAPQVAAAGAMMRVLNPFASLSDVLSTLKRTAQRPAGTGWSAELGWGILNAGAALDAIRRVDRLPPEASLVAPRLSRSRHFGLRWTGQDREYPGLIASGIARYEVYVRTNGGRARLLTRTTARRLTFNGRRGSRYRFYVVAVDRAGNRALHAAVKTTAVARRAR